jgi:hypothetical protein
MKDPIIEELHKVRQKHAARFNYDVDAIAHDAQRRDRQEKRRLYAFKKGKLVVVKN